MWQLLRCFPYNSCEEIFAFLSAGVQVPVVVVMLGGYLNKIKIVQQAMENKIPVVVVKDSGGAASLIHRVYSRRLDG